MLCVVAGPGMPGDTLLLQTSGWCAPQLLNRGPQADSALWPSCYFPLRRGLELRGLA